MGSQNVHPGWGWVGGRRDWRLVDQEVISTGTVDIMQIVLMKFLHVEPEMARCARLPSTAVHSTPVPPCR